MVSLWFLDDGNLEFVKQIVVIALGPLGFKIVVFDMYFVNVFNLLVVWKGKAKLS